LDKASLNNAVARGEAREAALQDILSIIHRGGGNVQPVLDAVAKHATKLCSADYCNLWRIDGEILHHAATFGFPENELTDYLAHFPQVMPVGSASRRVWETKKTLHIKQAVGPNFADQVLAKTYGLEEVLGVPIPYQDQIWGTIVLGFRAENRPSNVEIRLVETFAEQVSIAIQNAALLDRTRETLEQQKATAEVLEIISQSRESEGPVFDAILERACALCNAPLAGLILGTSQDDLQKLAAQKGMFPEAIELFETGQMKMDGTLSYAAKSILEGRLIAHDDMGESELYAAGSPIVRSMVDASNIRSVLFVPLMKDGAALGNLTMFRREVRAFNAQEIKLVESFAAQAVIAIENVRQFRELEKLNAELGDRVAEQVGEIERMGKLKRFLPAAVADTVVSSGSENMLKSHRALLGVLFCDIRGFTAFCETAEPEETIEVLQTYHQEMGKLINAHGAGVDHRMGDGIMVLFNDPLPCDDPAGDAVRLAIAMQMRMAELCRTWKRMGYRLGFGVGVSLGYATVGMVGFEGRFDYTASGTAINLASRLCDEAEDGEILLSPRAAIAVEDEFQVESRGELSLKGLREPIEVFRLAVGTAS
jgi:class 3 adenylate cyclase/GAF domain-containing protein